MDGDLVTTGDTAAPAEAPVSTFGPGWPITRFHPVHGGATFDDPNAYAKAGGDEGDWRFKTEGEADAARTGTEAAIVQAKTLAVKLEKLAAEGMAVVRNSVSAERSAQAGNAEPGLN